jgi:hypothetical protein
LAGVGSVWKPDESREVTLSMARIGMNPARGQFSSYRPARVTVAVLVYVPHLAGYFEHRFEVLKTCLGSILANTDGPYDLLVFDNGSCEEVRQYLRDLQRAGRIRYLLHTDANIGKIGAFQVLFRTAPGEVVAYCDDDIYFYPGWLGAHLRILDAYPNVGMVSGCAVRTLFNDERISSNLRFAEERPEVRLERGRFIQDHWMRDWAESYGRDYETVCRETAAVEDLVLEFNGLRVFAMANHNQFLAPKAVIEANLPKGWSGRLMGEMNDLDIAVNRAGFLRLATMERTTQHLGNRISPRMADALAAQAAPPPTASRAARMGGARGLRRWVLRSRPVRWLLLGIYSRLFRLLNPD